MMSKLSCALLAAVVQPERDVCQSACTRALYLPFGPEKLLASNLLVKYWCGRGKMGKAPDPAPKWVGNIIAKLLTSIGPKGLEFGRYSIDYHYIRNYIHVNRHWKADRAKRHIPEFALKLVDMYNQDGSVDGR